MTANSQKGIPPCDTSSTATRPDGWVLSGSSGFTLSSYNTVEVWGHDSLPGSIDSILLTANVPEPGTFMLATTGVVGLLAYAWRKRR